MSAKTTVASALLIGILGAGVWAAWHLSQADAANAAEEPQPATLGTDRDAERVMPTVMTGDALPPKPQQNPRDISLMTKLPDGSYIPNLNGVREPMTWSGPFSPIVGIRRTDLGVDWWVHENGMQSTVFIAEGTANGVPVRHPMLQIAVPEDIAPAVAAPKRN